MYITERCVFELKADGLHLTEIAPGIDLQKDILDQMEFKPVIEGEPKLMDARLFADALMGLKKTNQYKRSSYGTAPFIMSINNFIAGLNHLFL